VPDRRARRPIRRWAALVVAGATVVVAVAAAWLQPGAPGDFYATPADLSIHPPGTLLAAEPLEQNLPNGVDGWRVLYASTDADGEPSAVSGMVLVPTAAFEGLRPVVAIAHGSTGVDEDCAPSLSPRPLSPLPGVEQALDAGFAVAATDYPGLGTEGPHPYLIGSASGHAVLDSVRAAAQLIALDTDRVAVWGFSQGGHAALFAGELASTYAPEVGLTGVVAFAPAADLAEIVRTSQGTVFGTLIVVQATVAWSDARDDLDLESVIDPGSISTAREIADRCLDPTSLPAAVLQSTQLIDDIIPLDDPAAEAWAPFLDANTPSGDLDVPLLLFQGAEDPIIRPAMTERFAADRCAAGASVELRIIPGAGHFTLTRRTADDAVAWTQERFAGDEPLVTC
jgi:acetyl esterase/lipase